MNSFRHGDFYYYLSAKFSDEKLEFMNGEMNYFINHQNLQYPNNRELTFAAKQFATFDEFFERIIGHSDYRTILNLWTVEEVFTQWYEYYWPSMININIDVKKKYIQAKILFYQLDGKKNYMYINNDVRYKLWTEFMCSYYKSSDSSEYQFTQNIRKLCYPVKYLLNSDMSTYKDAFIAFRQVLYFSNLGLHTLSLEKVRCFISILQLYAKYYNIYKTKEQHKELISCGNENTKPLISLFVHDKQQLKDLNMLKEERIKTQIEFENETRMGVKTDDDIQAEKLQELQLKNLMLKQQEDEYRKQVNNPDVIANQIEADISQQTKQMSTISNEPQNKNAQPIKFLNSEENVVENLLQHPESINFDNVQIALQQSFENTDIPILNPSTGKMYELTVEAKSKLHNELLKYLKQGEGLLTNSPDGTKDDVDKYIRQNQEIILDSKENKLKDYDEIQVKNYLIEQLDGINKLKNTSMFSALINPPQKK